MPSTKTVVLSSPSCRATSLLLLVLLALGATAEDFVLSKSPGRAKWNEHRPLVVEDHHLSALAALSDRDRFNATLASILVPRVVGTPGHRAVRQFIQQKMSALQWTMESDRFVERTPNMGELEFENVIATLDPQAERFLVLACHYDSKYFNDTVFLGASDSAVPCAMLVDMAEVLTERLRRRSEADRAALSLKLVFFDGEEAFVEWSATDSLYGSRHLAQRWQEEGKLEQIDMLVLLDLLGMPDPQFFSLFRTTDPWYAHLAECEQRLAALELIARDVPSGVIQRQRNAYFQEQFVDAFVDDDHAPFMRRDVPIVHVIPLPFPDEWHTVADDWRVVDHVTVDNLMRIFRVFVVQYLRVEWE